ESFMRHISLLMRHELYLEGQNVWNQGVVKNGMICIKRGVLEILSDEDDESPMIAFKDGTRAIEKYDLDDSRLIKTRYRPMKVLKEHLAGIEEEDPTFVDDSHMYYKDENNESCRKFTTEYLGLYQLSNNVTSIKEPRICLRANFPWILEPNTDFNVRKMTVREIIEEKMATTGFYLDIISVFPLYIFTDTLDPQNESMATQIAAMLPMLQVWHIWDYLDKWQNNFNSNAKDSMRDLFYFLSVNHVSGKIKARVKKFFLVQWYYNNAVSSEEIFKDMSSNIQQEVLALQMIESFQYCPLFQGHCNKLNHFGKVESSIGPGSVVGVIEMVYGLPKVHTVLTCTNCSLLHIEYSALVQCWSTFPDIKHPIFETIKNPEIEKEASKFVDGKPLMGRIDTRTNRFAVFRITGAFTFWESDIMRVNEAVILLKFLPVAVTIVNLVAALIFMNSCTPYTVSTTNLIMVNCTRVMVLSSENHKIKCCGCMPVAIPNNSDIWLTMALQIFGILYFAFMFGYIASTRSASSHALLEHNENAQDLANFLYQANVDPILTIKTLKYFEYVWKRTHGSDPQKICRGLNCALMEDTLVFMYERALREVPLFGKVERSFIRVITQHLHEMYFLKGDTVVQCKDIQSNIYIIYRGKVDVMNSYNEMITCMGPGGMFGNFTGQTVSSSEVAIYASRNLDLLVLPAQTFFNLVKYYPKIQEPLNRAFEVSKNYILPITVDNEDTSSSDSDFDILSQDSAFDSRSGSSRYDTVGVQYKLPSAQSTSNISQAKSSASVMTYQSYMDINNLLKPGSKLYQGYGYITCAIATANYVLALYELVTLNDCYILFWLQYFFDVFFYVKIYLSMHRGYLNRHGDLILDSSKCRARYYRHKLWMWSDLLANLPTELFGFCFYDTSQTQWDYTTSFYIIVAELTTTGGDEFLVDYLLPIIILSISLVCGKMLAAIVIATAMQVEYSTKYALNKYERATGELLDVLKNQGLSSYQLKKICKYVRQLWVTERGRQLPVLLSRTPYVLRCDLMSAMFGQHLRNCFLFADTGQPFLRQLTALLEYSVFFPGNYIVVAGDSEARMHWVASGTVSVVSVKSDLTETTHEILNVGDVFGILQGLNRGITHCFSYRAQTKVSILTLSLDSWINLLPYFPDAQRIIAERAQILFTRI
ncbi:unnamed protein product, partial [Danaus chrysippus]